MSGHPSASVRRIWVHTTVAPSAVLAFLLATVGAASAGNGGWTLPPASADSTSTGYTGTAQVTFTVGGTPPVTTTHSVQVPAQCWWTPAPGTYTDPNAILADYTSGALSDATYSAYAFTTWAPIQSTQPPARRSPNTVSSPDHRTTISCRPHPTHDVSAQGQTRVKHTEGRSSTSKNRPLTCGDLVGDTGFEPVTSSV